MSCTLYSYCCCRSYIYSRNLSVLNDLAREMGMVSYMVCPMRESFRWSCWRQALRACDHSTQRSPTTTVCCAAVISTSDLRLRPFFRLFRFQKKFRFQVGCRLPKASLPKCHSMCPPTRFFPRASLRLGLRDSKMSASHVCLAFTAVWSLGFMYVRMP